MKYSVPLLGAVLCASVSAWMPGYDRDIFHMVDSHTEQNRFKREIQNGTNVKTNWLPGHLPIRGVNVGSMFVFEPWLAHDYWQNTMGCKDDGYDSEFNCVSKLGQDKANKVFQQHWATWITQSDIQKMTSLGLNTIRVPVGYWMMESLIYSSEHFPRGGWNYFLKVCDWARQAGMYIVVDLHGAPYSQSSGKNADTGQYRDPGFYDNGDAYERSYKFLEWLTTNIHTKSELANVGMIEILNEPIQDQGRTQGMLNNFYPTAHDRIRAAEAKLNIKKNDLLHIEVMNQKWGSGNPNQALKDLWFMAFDDHRYLKWAPGHQDNQQWYMQTSCKDDRGGNWPTIVGEFSLSTNNDIWDPKTNKDFYRNWFGAQVRAYEKQDGWIFWTWKTSGLNDPRWDYQLAVEQGIIPKNLDDVYHFGGC